MNLSEKFPHASKQFLALNDMTNPSQTSIPAPKPLPQKGRLRQNAGGLNKLEQAFKEWLLGQTTRPENGRLETQAITLKIANGCRYTPDFILIADTIDGDCYQPLAYEVKGFMRDDAAVKLKVAASLYPWIKFHLVTRKKGEWLIQEILP